MTHIALPLWLLITTLAAPSIMLLVWGIRGLKKRRQQGDYGSDQGSDILIVDPKANHAFHRDLCALQIDAVFNALSALMEAERLKLKTLLCSTVGPGASSGVAQPDRDTQTVQVDKQDQPRTIRRKIADRAAAGHAPGDIANALGISRSEVELAMSMNPGPADGRPRRLEAVA